MRTVFGAHLVLAVALLTFDAAAVSAQEDRVFIDPDSPAGTEYAIPLEQARREAAGGGPTNQGRAGNGQPLFGAGIAPPSEAKGESTAKGDSAIGDARAGAARKPRTAGDDKKPRAGSNPGASTAAITAAAGDGNSEGLVTAGIAAAVLALGLATGLAFRRATKGP